MTLYTGKGDDGTTTTFGYDQRISKSSSVAEALGTLDEANSYLGICKLYASKDKLNINGKEVSGIVHELQDDMFIIQAEVAGAGKTMPAGKVEWLECMITDVEEELPLIKSFFIAGGTELAVAFDFARTLVRRAERRVVGVHDEGVQKISKHTLAYLNRLSSILYALARLANYQQNISEYTPDYR
jgi:cob(I)alamin adenosyltransferase